MRAELDRRFLEDARDALVRQGEMAEEREQVAWQVLGDVAAEPNILKPPYASDVWSNGYLAVFASAALSPLARSVVAPMPQ